MKRSEGFRTSVVKKTQDGRGRTIQQIAKETGVNVLTTKNWIIKAEHLQLLQKKLNRRRQGFSYANGIT